MIETLKKQSLLAIAIAAASTPVVAEESEIIEEVITIGTRVEGRSAADSAVPIDIITGEDFVNQGDSDLNSLLRNVVPSYNVNTQPISDAASLVRPANLRGLAPDHTLVLVNGKRRHRAAVIAWLGNGVSDGAQGPDISQIPSIALQQVEVLRDGAAAQYGSDAIAGVINFQLKDDNDGGAIEVKAGQFYEGDGRQFTVAGNYGMPFTDQGFVNVSFEAGSKQDTDRSVQRDDAAGLIAAGNTAVATPAQVWGSPEIKDDFKSVVNLGLELGGGKEFYAFGNYGSKTVDGGFYFRNPETRSAVFSDGSGPLIGDLNPDNGLDSCAGFTHAQAIASDECFSFQEMFPGGFTPRFGGDVTDLSGLAGVRGELDNGWAYDVSASLGYNDVDFFIYNTVNASLGPQSPTSFNPGAYTQLEKNFNIDLIKGFEVGLASELSVATGFEWRDETFEITTGDQASYEIGPLAAQGFSAASNGFPGFGPLAGGQWSRSNLATYIDMEADIVDGWLLAGALRFEDFEDFGTTVNGKLATNLELSEAVSLRASWSTGFRAPTPGQSNAFNVSTEFDVALNDLVNNGTIPSTNPVAQLRGGEALDPEESTNWTIGAVFSAGPIDVTIDYFNIELEGRIAPSQLYSLTQTEVDTLVASGVTSAANLQNFRFFTNDFDTTTKGFDIVATYGTDAIGDSTDISLAFNQTQTAVDSFTPETIDATRIRELEEGLPETRWNLSSTTFVGDWRFLARASYYDDWYDSEDDQKYSGEVIVDAEVSYAFNEQASVILGAQNILDQTPEENPGAAGGVGNRYSQFSPFGFEGGFYYLRTRYEF
ncbi:TonB-dependent receptor plug domain-containing protein [Microbulbifer agarilyticus]|uniref:TonB-dependent receptor plug domain-containing protein n=1 Tax=Microbulbifer agarilyticus TaxID=260552 RepID=UPI001CD7A3C8|nr:TonB-dependent receptor [Microbulbifer agarilyticus]MCA0893008.1 TonB-dependent receptor [Microbulbifer agarilyticus]